jgi:Tol biopolymer transport system component
VTRRWTCAVAALAVAVAIVPLGDGIADATFPGAVGRLAFASDREGGTFNIFTMNPDGSNPARVTDHPASDRNPVWDPKARHLLFVSERAGQQRDIYRIDDTGGIVRTITEGPEDNLGPAYDERRKLIVFQTDRDGNDEIYSMETNGKNQRNLTLHQPGDLPPVDPASNIDPHVGSNNRIVFASDRETPGNYEIFTMRLDGSDVRRIDPFDREDNEDHSNTQPKWSPGARRIVFVSDFDSGDPTNLDLYVMNADGRNVQRLTSNPNDDPVDDRNPAWSPDGARIAWDSNRHGAANREIYVMNADGSDQRRITNNGINDREPAWQSVKDRQAFDDVEGSPRRAVSDGREMGSGSRVGTPDPAPDAGPDAAADPPADSEADSGEASGEEAEATVAAEQPLLVQPVADTREAGSFGFLEAGALVAVLMAFAVGVLAIRLRTS